MKISTHITICCLVLIGMGSPGFADIKQPVKKSGRGLEGSVETLAETFDIGQDTGTQVSRLYDGPFPFVGKLDRVDITLRN